jgi:Mrp family chromosome partitioning ATPase
MLRGRGRLPVLAEVSGPSEGTRSWSLRKSDLAGLAQALPRLEGQQVVLVTGDAEAAVVAAIALASAAVAGGRRTILVECDLTKPKLAAHLGLAAAPGVHEYLRWEAEPGDVLQPLALGGPAATGASEPLVCICGGRPASKTETLLNLQSFAHMVEKLRHAYELVVLTGPPVEEEPATCEAAACQADAMVAALPTTAATGRASRSVHSAFKRLPVPAIGTISVAP